MKKTLALLMIALLISLVMGECYGTGEVPGFIMRMDGESMNDTIMDKQILSVERRNIADFMRFDIILPETNGTGLLRECRSLFRCVRGGNQKNAGNVRECPVLPG